MIAGPDPLLRDCYLQWRAQLERVSPKSCRVTFSGPALFRRRLVHHGFELHAVGVGEIDRVIGAPVIFARRIDYGHAVRFEEGAERVHVVAARKLEGVVVEADVALAVLALLALRVGGGDPEQRLAVAPAGHVGVVVFELEAEEAEDLAVELLRAREVADAQHQVIDTDDAGHDVSPSARLLRRWLPPPRAPAAAHAGAPGGRARARAIGLGFFVRAGAHLVERGFARTFVHARHPARLRRATLAPRAGRGRRPAARDRDRLGGGVVDDRELGGAQALDLVAQPRGFLEVEIGGGRAHARLEVGDHRLEIVADGGSGLLVADAGKPAAGRDQHVVALVDRLQNVGDVAAHALRRDAVRGVERFLLFTPPIGLGDGALHRAGHGVGIEDDTAVDVARGAADGLNERGLAAQESLLVGVEDRNQRAFRNVEALA